MAILPKPSSPVGAIRDLIEVIRAPRKHKMVFAALSFVLPAAILVGMLQQAHVDEEWVPPTIVYVKQWPANRSIVDVRAQQARDLPAELAAKKEREAAAEATRQAYRRLADKMGIDVDKKRQ